MIDKVTEEMLQQLLERKIHRYLISLDIIGSTKKVKDKGLDNELLFEIFNNFIKQECDNITMNNVSLIILEEMKSFNSGDSFKISIDDGYSEMVKELIKSISNMINKLNNLLKNKNKVNFHIAIHYAKFSYNIDRTKVMTQLSVFSKKSTAKNIIISKEACKELEIENAKVSKKAYNILKYGNL